MKEETGHILSADGTKLFFRARTRAKTPAVFVIHGFGEHSGRYGELCDLIDSIGFSFFSYDLRGHGQSGGARVYVDQFKDFVDDTFTFINFATDRFGLGDQPHVLLGQSMGALIATHLVLYDQERWQLMILLSPYFSVARFNGFVHFFALSINAILPQLIWNNPIKPIFLTHDKKELIRYQCDQWIQRKITGRLAAEMFRACSVAMERAHEIVVPTCVLAAGNDRIVSLKATRKFYNRIASRAKRLNILDGFYHEIIHERKRDKAFRILKECFNSMAQPCADDPQTSY